MNYKNPIIRGFYPDPSVCRVKNKYYLVCSSFQYFPGVPLFESDDLVNWESIGYCLTRESQLPLSNAHSSGGIFAPTIRYNDNRFYMVTTNVTGGGNFYVYTDDIYGEWSEPVFVEQGGIDPSLYFENGKAYFMSNGDEAIWQCEIDIKTGKKLTQSKILWKGTGGRYLESPHLYKIGKYYYLMAAEGGTEYGHMVTYARSEDIGGPYIPYEKNPVLTNRNLGGYEIQGIGHADLTDDENGNWWIFHLGFRQIGRWLNYHHLGRETFLMPVSFDKDGWFMAGENGTTVKSVDTDKILNNIKQKIKTEYTFENTDQKKDWRFIRSFNKNNYIFINDALQIKSSADNLDSVGSPSFVGMPQREFDMNVSVNIKTNDGEAGLTLYMDECHHYDFSLQKDKDNFYVVLRFIVGDIKYVKSKIHVNSNEVNLKIKSNPLTYEFIYCGKEEEVLATAQTKYLSTEVAGGFTGVMIGLYSQNGEQGLFNEFKGFSCCYKI